MKFFQYFVFALILALCLFGEPTEASFRKKLHKAIKKLKHTIHEAGSVAGDAASVVAGGASVGAVLG